MNLVVLGGRLVCEPDLRELADGLLILDVQLVLLVSGDALQCSRAVVGVAVGRGVGRAVEELHDPGSIAAMKPANAAATGGLPFAQPMSSGNSACSTKRRDSPASFGRLTARANSRGAIRVVTGRSARGPGKGLGEARIVTIRLM
jgi:hypothetical protein